jgi:protoheme ferro-lyase
MKKGLNITSSVGLAVIFCGLAWAMNSLVSPEDIKKLKEAKISDAVIQLLVAEQTCSVTADFLMSLKSSGADDEMLKLVILADRYKDPARANLSAEQIEILKKAGYSDEMIVQLFHVTPIKKVVDKQGNESIVYGTGVLPKPETTAPAQPPHIFNINIEKVERP